MATFHWILCALFSSFLHRGNARPIPPQPAQQLLQLRNFHRPEISTGMSHSDEMSIKRRDSAAEVFGITADNKAPRQHHQHVFSQSKISAEIVPYQKAPPSMMQMEKSDSLQSPQWLATERERWRQVQPSSFPNSFSSPNPYARSNPTPLFVYPSSYPNPSRSVYPSPSLKPSRLVDPPLFPNPSAYPSTVLYPSPSFAPAFENNRISLSPLPHQNNLIRLLPQPSSPSPNWMSEKMQTATAVTGDNRGDSSKDLMAKLWTFGTVTPTPVNHGDITTKMYQMIFDEHGNMHIMNSAGLAY